MKATPDSFDQFFRNLAPSTRIDKYHNCNWSIQKCEATILKSALEVGKEYLVHLQIDFVCSQTTAMAIIYA